MNHSNNHAPAAHPLAIVAGLCGVASVAIVALIFCLRRDISGTEMWAVAAMTAAPSLMGTAMAYFITKQPSQLTSSTAPHGEISRG